METRVAEIRDTLLLSAAVVFGLLVPPALAVVGMSLAAAGIAALAYRGRVWNAVFAIALGTAVVVLLDAPQAVFTVPAALAVVMAVVLLPRVDVQWVGAGIWLIVSAADAGSELLSMKLANTTPAGEIHDIVQLMVKSGAMSSTGPDAKAFESLMLSVLPTVYAFTGFLTAVAIIAGVVWAANRSGRSLKVPPLGKLDLTPHVMWPFIAGLLALAASYGKVPYAAALQVIGLNLLLCVRALFALQGFGVSAGVLDRAGVGLGGRILALAALAALDVFTLAVSLVGLLDFWINFRRLPRDGATPQEPTAAMSDR